MEVYPRLQKNTPEFANMGRKRWKIENEAFNIQKNHRYDIRHANSLDYRAMKNHYLLTQVSDILHKETHINKYLLMMIIAKEVVFGKEKIKNLKKLFTEKRK